MISAAQLEEGIRYAEANYRDNDQGHLQVDKQLIRNKFDLNGAKVLDFGCGMGGMSMWYADNWDCEVYALDIDSHHITVARKVQEKHQIKNVTFSQRNILNEPLESHERFDWVFLNDVAEHISYDILEQIFRQLSQRLSPEGRILVTYPPWESPYASHVTHAVKIPWCQYLPQKMLTRLIEKNNQQIVGELESDLVSAYKGLNHLTHRRLMQILNRSGLTPVYRRSHSIINRLPGMRELNLSFFPFKYLITKEFLLLRPTTQVK